jgi:hypothetical protein
MLAASAGELWSGFARFGPLLGSQKKLLAGSEEVIAQDGHSPPGVACGEIVLPTSRGFKYLIF